MSKTQWRLCKWKAGIGQTREWMQYLQTVVDSSGVSGRNQRLRVTDFHQGRRVDVVVVVHRGLGPPQCLRFLPIVKSFRLTVIAQINLYLRHRVPCPPAVHPNMWRKHNPKRERMREQGVCLWCVCPTVGHLYSAALCWQGTLRLYWDHTVLWLAFADGVWSQDRFPVLWWDMKDRWDINTVGMEMSVCVCVYTDTRGEPQSQQRRKVKY